MRLTFLVLALLVALPGCGDPGPPFDVEGEGGVPVDVAFFSDVPFVPVTHEDDPPRDFLLDTGSPATLLDPDAYALPEGNHHPERFSFLGITALSPPLGVLDLFGDELEVGGILGGDVLRWFAVTVDYRAAQAVLYPALDGAVPDFGTDLAPAIQIGFALRGGGLLPLTPTDDLPVPATRILVSLLLEGRVVQAVLDTGASSVVLDEGLFDDLFTERPDRPLFHGLQVITVDGALDTELSRAATLSLQEAPQASQRTSVEIMTVRGSVALESVSIEVGRQVDALLGGAYLRWFQTTLDYPAQVLTLRAYQTADHVNPAEWQTVGFTWVETAPGQVWVNTVYPDTHAETAGLQTGDRILTAGDHDIALVGRAGVEAAVDASALGDRVPFTFDRDGAPYQADVEIEDLLPAFE